MILLTALFTVLYVNYVGSCTFMFIFATFRFVISAGLFLCYFCEFPQFTGFPVFCKYYIFITLIASMVFFCFDYFN